MNIQILFVLLSLLLSAVCGFVTIPLILRYCKQHHLYDQPDERKIHSNAIPRLGGICFLPCGFLAFVTAFYFLQTSHDAHSIRLSLWTCFFFSSLLVIYVIGFIDDIIGLNARIKFSAQIISATFLPLGGLYLNDLYGLFGVHAIPYYVGVPLTIFLVVFIVNAINLIDGIDGLAGGLTIVALSGFLFGFMREGLFLYSLLIGSIIGVLIAYLYFNIFGKELKNTKIFMGDSGSLSLGFILSFLFIKFTMNNPSVLSFHSDAFVLAFSLVFVPCMDVVRVTLGRVFRSQPVFVADKTHLHHRLLQVGLSQRKALIVILILALFILCFNLFLLPYISTTGVFLSDIFVYVLFLVILNKIIKDKHIRLST